VKAPAPGELIVIRLWEIVDIMTRYNVIYESKEDIYGIVPKAYDWVHYSSILRVKDGGKKIPDGHFKIPHLWPGQNTPATG
jgi:hypothetical protein